MFLLPLDLENIILDYNYQLNHTEKFNNVLKEMDKMKFIRKYCEERNICFTSQKYSFKEYDKIRRLNKYDGVLFYDVGSLKKNLYLSF